MKLASFDIFDTALIRKCGRPENIIYLLAYRLYPNDIVKREDFIRWRLNAEHNAAVRYNREVGLSDIYETARSGGFYEWTAEEFEAQEKTIESENLIGNPNVIALIRQKREEGFSICFISDMYLDSYFLKSILRREGCLSGDEPVFVSCEENARKSNGTMYFKIQESMQAETWTHFGDNRYSDVKVARRFGIKSRLISSGFTDVEKAVIEESAKQRDTYALSQLAGLSRSSRIINGLSSEATLAADFVSATYIPYALFVLKQAREQGIKRLYFLSRDSYILMKALQALSPDDIELRYLFVSRQSLFLPCMTEPTAECFLAMLDQNTVYRKHVDDMLHKLRTDRMELAILGITFDYNHIKTREQERNFLNKIFNGAFVPVLKRKIEMSRQLLLSYFEQELLFDDVEYAMVDIGWLGTSRLMINNILEHAKCRRPLFFYFGIRRDVLPASCGRYISYFPAEQLTVDSVSLLESYFSASPYPTTIDYRKNEGRIEPVFQEDKHYVETQVIRANIKSIEQLISDIAGLQFLDDYILYQWAHLSLDRLVDLNDDMNLSPISQCTGFGKEPLARKLAFSELGLLLACGKQITASDRISIYMTCKKWLRKPVLKYYETGNKIKSFIYRKYIYKAL